MMAAVAAVIINMNEATAQQNINNEKGSDKASSAQPSSAAPSVRQARKTSKLAVAAVQAGFARCADRAEKVERFLAGQMNSTLIVDNANDGNSSAIFSGTMIIQLSQEMRSKVEIVLDSSFAGCPGLYSASTYVKEPCNTAQDKFYPGLEFKGLPGSGVRIALIGSRARVLSEDLSAGCLLTKNEVVK
jgi:hypothetical protein